METTKETQNKPESHRERRTDREPPDTLKTAFTPAVGKNSIDETQQRSYALSEPSKGTERSRSRTNQIYSFGYGLKLLSHSGDYKAKEKSQ